MAINLSNQFELIPAHIVIVRYVYDSKTNYDIIGITNQFCRHDQTYVIVFPIVAMVNTYRSEEYRTMLSKISGLDYDQLFNGKIQYLQCLVKCDNIIEKVQDEAAENVFLQLEESNRREREQREFEMEIARSIRYRA